MSEKQKPSEVVGDISQQVNELMAKAMGMAGDGGAKLSEAIKKAQTDYTQARESGMTGPEAMASTVGLPMKPTPGNTSGATNAQAQAKKESDEADEKKEKEKFIEISKLKVFGLICAASFIPGVSFLGSAATIAGGIWGINKLMENDTVKAAYDGMKSKVAEFFQPGKPAATAEAPIPQLPAPEAVAPALAQVAPQEKNRVEDLIAQIDFSKLDPNFVKDLSNKLSNPVVPESSMAPNIPANSELVDRIGQMVTQHADLLNTVKKDLPKPGMI